ncbi:FAD-dependent monooxygenase [Undibacterium sp.]|uniref:FAD-dependent monooxygenase n=1 Tax=Undibacterium sp. TaxID=1914977 RepID=UPI002C99390C|nr:FAD-dependent monooxygenase [Undibacterium sp.]HTD05113.1 FAD-dependent monooxygenase [Undibacterium sp.]
MRETDIPVLIVGAGPVGMLTAALLADRGIESLIIEQRQDLHLAPQAHVINSRTQEILSEIGIADEEIKGISTHADSARNVTWRRTLASGDLASIDIGSQAYTGKLENVSSKVTTNIPQHQLERMLFKHLSRRVLCRTAFGQTWLGAEQFKDHVVSRLKDMATGEEYRVRSSWIVAADGASSRVRRDCGIEMIGKTDLANLITINFEGDIRHLVQNSPSILFWIMSAKCPGTFIVHDEARYSVFMTPYFPPHESPKDYPVERCERILRSALGDDKMPVRVTSISSWTMQSHTAQTYSKGRIFLVGDAAHRFPPTGGLGLNTGAADAQNLAWKLALVIKGKADRALLQTYESERKPVAQVNGQASTDNHHKMREVTDALGLNLDHLPMMARLRASAPVRLLPRALRSACKNLLVIPIEARTNKIQKAATDNYANRKSAVQQAAEDQFAHFNTIGLDLGYVYRGKAISNDGSRPPPVGNPVLDYTQSFCPGARFPHFRLAAPAGVKKSSYTLIGGDRFLLAGMGCHGKTASQFAGAIAEALEVAIDAADLNIVTHPDDASRLANLNDQRPDGLFLVRPDGHTAWRHNRSEPVQVAELITVFADLFCLDRPDQMNKVAASS